MLTHAGFYIAKGQKGFGVYAARTIHPGDEILRFTGPLIDFDATVRLGDRECDALQIGANIYLHLDEPGALVNHSCAPNAGVMDDLHLVALTTIHPRQEICFDYSTTMDDNHWTMNCLCGESECRERIVDFRFLPEALQQRYLQQGIVQRFLAEEFAPLAPSRVPTPLRGLVAAYSSSDAK